MLFKKVHLLSLCIGLTQVLATFPSIAAPLIVNDNKTGVRSLIKFDKDPIVNINLSNAPVGDVLKALVDQIGYNMIVNTDAKAIDDVIPRIEFNNIKLSEAMSFILRLKNLTVKKINKTLFISDQKAQTSSGIDDSMIKTYKLSNLKPTEAVTKIEQFYVAPLTPPKLIPTDETNSLAVIARPTEIDYLDSLISIVDIPVPQVMIEIKLIELSEQASRNLGVAYGFGQKQFGIGFNNSVAGGAAAAAGPQGAQIGQVATGAAATQSPALTLSFDALRNYTANFNAQVNALVQNSKAKVLSNPRIATQNGKKAIFMSTEQAPVIETSQSATGSTQAVKTINIGETINVTPTMVDPSTGFVTLELNPQISSRGKDVIVNGNPVPETLLRTVTTTMKVKSGESIVLGGLKRRNNTNASNKIPILGDIPFLGQLFGANSWADSETELIIMVTPYILDEAGNGPKTETSSGQ